MRAKIAKKIRRAARRRTFGLPENQLTHKPTKVIEVFGGELNADGSRKAVAYLNTPSEGWRLDPISTCAVYKQMKREYK